MGNTARAKMAEAQKKRWQAFHKKQAPKAVVKTTAPKRRLSAATKAKFAANLKKARAAKAAKRAVA
jgi:hypothetical protein